MPLLLVAMPFLLVASCLLLVTYPNYAKSSRHTPQQGDDLRRLECLKE